jgi:hypothetical protein
MPKKFKTLGGLLRNATDKLYEAQARAEMRGQTIEPPAFEKYQRDCINQVLPQIGVGRLDVNEPLVDGIKRLREQATEQQQQHLDTCLEWLTTTKHKRVRTTFVGATSERVGTIVGGKEQ